jgi:hypothetical protein
MKIEMEQSGEIDVTKTAKTFGFKMQVVLSREVWELIDGAPHNSRDEAETPERLRQLLKTVSRELRWVPRSNFKFIFGRRGDFRVGAVTLLGDDHAPHLAIRLAHETPGVTITRSRWKRATKASGSHCGSLFDGSGYCCLGFVCRQVFGKTDGEMLGKKMPDEVGVPNNLRGLPGGLVQAAAELNDRVATRSGNEDYHLMSDTEQEQRIADLFESVGIAVQFID